MMRIIHIDCQSMPCSQRGLSFFGVMMSITVIGMVVLFGLKVGPLYMEYGKVSSVLDGMAVELASSKMTKQEISKNIQRRFDVNDVSRVKTKDHLTIKRIKGGKMELTIEYEARAPLAHNLSVIAHFKKVVTSGEGGS